jgi:hypothetical protein
MIFQVRIEAVKMSKEDVRLAQENEIEVLKVSNSASFSFSVKLLLMIIITVSCNCLGLFRQFTSEMSMMKVIHRPSLCSSLSDCFLRKGAVEVELRMDTRS